MGGPVESFAGAPTAGGRGGGRRSGGPGGGRGPGGGAAVAERADAAADDGNVERPAVRGAGRWAAAAQPGGAGRGGRGRGELTPEQQAAQAASRSRPPS